MNYINFNEIKSFSKLFLSFINKKDSIMERFPTNLSQAEFIESKSMEASQCLIDALIKSMPEMTEAQKENLSLLQTGSALCVATGQQAGFLGGPLYSVYKAATAVAAANKFNEIYTQKKFVPLFWVEDNDHDAHEAAVAHIFGKDKTSMRFLADNDYAVSDRIISSARYFRGNITDIVNSVFDSLPPTIRTEELRGSLLDIYKKDENWSVAFIKFMNFVLPSTGILYLSASEARKAGMFKKIVLKELAFPGKTLDLINKGSSILDENGFHIQARAFFFNVFIHDGDKRYKIETTKEGMLSAGPHTFTLTGLRETALENPALFSPQVLLRPLVQDSSIPVAAYVAGPSEAAYLAQLKELYYDFNISMPLIIPRLSATLLDKKTSSFLENENKKLKDIFLDRHEFEKLTSEDLEDEELADKVEEMKLNLKTAIAPLEKCAERVSESIVRSVEASLHKILKEAESIEKRMNAAVIRKKQDEKDKYIHAWTMSYPNGALQERTYSPLTMLNIVGRDDFESLIMEKAKAHVKNLDKPVHHIAKL